MRSVITIGNLNVNRGGVHYVVRPAFSYKGILSGRTSLIALKPETAEKSRVAFVSRTPIRTDGRGSGFSVVYALKPDTDTAFVITLTKSGGGHKARTRELFVETMPGLPHIDVTLKVGGDDIAVYRGPGKILDDAGVKRRFGPSMRTGLMLRREDYKHLGITVQTEKVEETTYETTTVDASGNRVTLSVQRPTRATGF